MVILKTIAITSQGPASVRLAAGYKGALCISFKLLDDSNSAGGWGVDSLLAKGPMMVLLLDGGSEWRCSNMSAVMAEVRDLVINAGLTAIAQRS